ncbi:hypothetical protein, partial [Escherichia coli]|uniref:hypothetical protein n=1 Tax=Escherichia coli TaxID=562 RepID=UPI00301E57A8
TVVSKQLPYTFSHKLWRLLILIASLNKLKAPINRKTNKKNNFLLIKITNKQTRPKPNKKNKIRNNFITAFYNKK